MTHAHPAGTAGPGGDVRLVLRAPRPAVVEALGPGAGNCAVGPEADTGVVVRVAPTSDAGGLAARLSSALHAPVLEVSASSDTGLTVRWWREGTRAPVGGHPGADPVDGAAELARAFGVGEEAPAVLDALTLPDASSAVASLARALHLPALASGADPAGGLVVARGPRGRARLAASRLGGTWSARLRRWSVLVPDAPAWPDLVALANDAGRAGRRAVALVLWVDGPECGYLLCRRGHPVDSHVWNWPWQWLGPEGEVPVGLRPVTGSAAVLAVAAGRPREVAALHALLGASGPPALLLARLCGLLRVPVEVVGVLDGGRDPQDLPSARRHPVAVPAAPVGPGGAPDRRAQLVRGAADLAVAGVLAGVAAAEAAVVATDGALAGERTARWEDWVGTGVFGVLSVLSGVLGVRRLRRARR